MDMAHAITFAGRTALVTGATSGIGTELCRQLCQRNCQVVAVGRSQAKLDALKARLPDILPVRCDLASKGQVITLAQTLKAHDWPVSILINNAAVQFTPRFTDAEFSFDSIDLEITTNFTAVAWLTALLLPQLLDHPNGAAVANMSSGLAFYPKTSSALYCATKAAVHSLSQSLRYQLDGTAVQVLEVLLPLVDTPMTHGRGQGKISAAQAAQETLDAIESGTSELFVGKARLLPMLSRISPALTKRILKSA